MKSKIKNIEINPASDDGMRWIENISRGWRFVGYSDEIISSLRHTGYYTSEFQDEIMRGVVYKLPTQKFGAVYFVGYADPNNEDAARGMIVLNCENDTDAAREADSIAERCAENEREYQAAWQLGNEYADTFETIQSQRAERADMFTELRQLQYLLADSVGGNTPTLCAAIKARINATHRNIIEAYKRRRAIVKENYLRGSQLDAFADGASITTEQAKALF